MRAVWLVLLLGCDGNHTVGTMPGVECGGYARLPCPDFRDCIDDEDDCDPTVMGANCPGHCKE